MPGARANAVLSIVGHALQKISLTHLLIIATFLESHLAHTHGVELALFITNKDVFTPRSAHVATADGESDHVLLIVNPRSQNR